MIWYPLLARDTGMTQTWLVESHCSAFFLSDPESANAESRPQNLRFLCPLELDGNRFQWKPNGILVSGNGRLVSASSVFLKTGMVRIHTPPPSFSYSKSAVHLISHVSSCWQMFDASPTRIRMFLKTKIFSSFSKRMCIHVAYSNRFRNVLEINMFKFENFFQLIIGNFGLSYEQSKLQFALWAILASVSIHGYFYCLFLVHKRCLCMLFMYCCFSPVWALDCIDYLTIALVRKKCTNVISQSEWEEKLNI